MRLNHVDPKPRDRWILVDLDDGSQDCSEVPRDNLHLARWRPRVYKKLRNTYEWQVLQYGKFEQWSDGRIGGWCDLPKVSAGSRAMTRTAVQLVEKAGNVRRPRRTSPRLSANQGGAA